MEHIAVFNSDVSIFKETLVPNICTLESRTASYFKVSNKKKNYMNNKTVSRNYFMDAFILNRLAHKRRVGILNETHNIILLGNYIF